jgi:hypothetical protein
MDKISNQQFFSAILSSHILEPFLERDPDLAELIKAPDHPDIHYYETPALAKELAPALKHRLNVLAAKEISHNLEATKQLVAFIEDHPESLIYNVTFNAQKQHYGVRCGLIEDHVQIICVMTGGRIPDELLGGSPK